MRKLSNNNAKVKLHDKDTIFIKKQKGVNTENVKPVSVERRVKEDTVDIRESAC